MKLATQGTEVEVYGAETSEHVFNIQTSAVAFRTLSANLYTDRPTAIIRELACNAYDAHVEAGKKKIPFKLNLPTALNPEFCIRDFGTGMTDDKILDLYCTYFSSSKQGTNKQIGGFGIGSKSPFSYTNGFTVTSFVNGEKRTYSAFINEQQVPAVVRLSTEPTTEPNGLEVKFPVKQQDIMEFRVKAEKVLEFFDPLPIVNLPDFEVKKTTYDLIGKSWKIREPFSDIYGVRVIQGMVPYKVAIADFAAGAAGLNVDIFVSIGTVSPAANRESLTLDAHTVTRLKDILHRVDVELTEQLKAEVEKIQGGWQKMSFLSTFKEHKELQPFVKRVMQELVKDTSLFPSAEISSEKFPLLKVYEYYTYGGNHSNLMVGVQTFLDHNSFTTNVLVDKLGWFSKKFDSFIIVDRAKGGHSRVAAWMKANNIKRTVVVFPSEIPKEISTFDVKAHVEKAAEFFKAVGDPEYKLLCELEIPKDYNEYNYVWKPKIWRDHQVTNYTEMWWKQIEEKAYPTEGVHYYIKTHRNKVVGMDADASAGEAQQVIRYMVGYLGVSTLYSISTSDGVPTRTKAVWIDIVEACNAKMVEWLKNSHITVYENVPYEIGAGSFLKGSSSLLLQEAEAIRMNMELPHKHQAIRNHLAYLKNAELHKAYQAAVTVDKKRAVEVYSLIKKTYPLLSMSKRDELQSFYINEIDKQSTNNKESIGERE